MDQDALDGGRRNTHHTDVASVSGASLSTVSHAPQQQLVGMLSENRDLLEKLTATHSKLKQAKAKLTQWEQELRSKDFEVGGPIGRRVTNNDSSHGSHWIVNFHRLDVYARKWRPRVGL